MNICIVDTNVLLADPYIVNKLDDDLIVVPLAVIMEIDKKKKEQSDIGISARETSRVLNKLISAPEVLNAKGKKIEFKDAQTLYPCELNSRLNPLFADDAIVMIAADYATNNLKDTVVVFSEDIAVRLRARAYGVKFRSLDKFSIKTEGLYSGWRTVTVKTEIIDRLYDKRIVKVKEKVFFPNECVLLKSEDDKSQALARFVESRGGLVPVTTKNKKAYGLVSKNLEQSFALDLLFDPAIKLVTLTGESGTGKTILACAAALQQTLEDHEYRKVLISRPIFPLGKDIGFLPGPASEKLDPWMQPIYDNIELLNSFNQPKKNHKGQSKERIVEELIEVEPITYIRGRSIPQQFFIIDEAQNTTRHEIKTIITRVGEGTKIVLTGDIKQIDNPHVDMFSNGLSYVAEKFKGYAIAGHLALTKGERSDLATLASKIL